VADVGTHAPGSGLLDETDRVELMRGELIDMAPIGSRHANLVDVIAQLLVAPPASAPASASRTRSGSANSANPSPTSRGARRQLCRRPPRGGDVLLLTRSRRHTLEIDRDVKLPLYARPAFQNAGWLIVAVAA